MAACQIAAVTLEARGCLRPLTPTGAKPGIVACLPALRVATPTGAMVPTLGACAVAVTPLLAACAVAAPRFATWAIATAKGLATVVAGAASAAAFFAALFAALVAAAFFATLFDALVAAALLLTVVTVCTFKNALVNAGGFTCVPAI